LEYLIEYGMFLAKAITIVLAIVVVIAMAAASGSRQRRSGKRGTLHVTPLNEHFEEMSHGLKEAVLDKLELKLLDKAQRKLEKKEQKQKKAQAKAMAKKLEQQSAVRAFSPPADSESELEAEAEAEADRSGDASAQQPPANDGDSAPERRKRIFILDFKGNIPADGVTCLREEITAVLAIAEPRDEVLLKLESPGGMVHAYGLAASQLSRIKSAGVPLTICVDKVAASGGYMMACLADRLVAAPFAIIGSIGVIMQLPNFHRVLKKYDVDYEMLSAGEYKRTLSTFGEITEKGRGKAQEDVETIHELFKNWVKENRPSVEIDKVATGETWLGSQAKERYLVDEIRTSDECIVQACGHADVFEVEYRLRKNLQDRLGNAFEGAIESILTKFLQSNNRGDFQ
jgi:serine protease SohB